MDSMKAIFSKVALVFIFQFSFTGFYIAKAQDSGTGFDSFLRAGRDDGEKLIGYYMEPLVVGFSYGMSNGWFNTAKTHKSLGFDLTISANLASIPESKEYFTFNPEEYTHVRVNGENDQIPTILGPDNDNNPELEFSYYDENTGQTVTGYYTPTGLGLKKQVGINAVPSPMIQISVGTFRNTDIILRYVPQFTYHEFQTSLFGIGIKHDIKQWLPVIKRLPIDLSVLAAFSGFDNRYDMSELNISGENKAAVFNVNNWTVQGLISKKISVVTFYGSVGYSEVSSNLDVKGTYTIEDATDPSNTFSITDPVSLNYKEGSWRVTGGLRFKFGFFTLHGDYTFQRYHIISTGLGFSFR